MIKTWLARLLAILLGLAGTLVLLAGIGTACVAVDPFGYGPNMALLAPAQWQFLLVTLAGLGLGLFGVGVAVQMARGLRGAHRAGLAVLVLMAGYGWWRMELSRQLRGNSMPYDLIHYWVVAVLVLFVAGRFFLPEEQPRNGKPGNRAAGAVLLLAGLTAGVAGWMFAESHTWGGTNYANAFASWLPFGGLVVAASGVALLLPATLAWFNGVWAMACRQEERQARRNRDIMAK